MENNYFKGTTDIIGSLGASDSIYVNTSMYKFVYFIFNGAYATDTFSISAIMHGSLKKTYHIADGYSFTIEPYINSDNQLSVKLQVTGYSSGGVRVMCIR